MKTLILPDARGVQSERGFGIVMVLLILLLVSALTTAQMADTLLESRITSNEMSYQLALSSAHSVFHMALESLLTVSRTNLDWSWDPILKGQDGNPDPCLTVVENRLNPIDLGAAGRVPAGSLLNACGDDGTLYDWISGGKIIGSGGVRIVGDGNQTDFLPASASSPPGEPGLRAWAWIKFSDNDEPDRDVSRDTDSIVILRVVAVAPNLPGGAGSPARMNAVAIVEVWLKHGNLGPVELLSVREVSP